MTARIHGLFKAATECHYPDKEFATVRAVAALKNVLVSRIEDDRGDELFVVSWGSFTKHCRQLSDAQRLVESIPDTHK